MSPAIFAVSAMLIVIFMTYETISVVSSVIDNRSDSMRIVLLKYKKRAPAFVLEMLCRRRRQALSLIEADSWSKTPSVSKPFVESYTNYVIYILRVNCGFQCSAATALTRTRKN